MHSSFRRYLAFLGDHAGSLQPTCAPGQPLKPHPTKVVCYSLALRDLRQTIDQAGHNGSAYTEHSNKRGGATHAANAGLNDEEIQEIGNWKHLKTAQIYIEHSTPQRQKRQQKLLNLI